MSYLTPSSIRVSNYIPYNRVNYNPQEQDYNRIKNFSQKGEAIAPRVVGFTTKTTEQYSTILNKGVYL